jgi:2-oxoisovalerate dehydrogenase E2 component (dihydrolipoyl transacylase)
MGSHVIKMPDIGEGIAEVELAAWHVGPGDTVAEDQVLADVMTDKATVEIPSPVAGTVLALGGKPGASIAVGAELIRIEVAGAGNVADGAGPAAQPAAARSAAGATGAAFTPRFPGDKPLASPAVRQYARDRDVDLRQVTGSGPAGRIQRDDIDACLKRDAGRATADARYAARHGETAVPVIGLRRQIARRMQEAKRRIPHFTYVEEVDVTEIEDLRARLNTRYRSERGRLTLLPLLMRALVLALREFPQINARFDDEAGVVTRHAAVHVGIATQTDHGLLVPVVRHAEALDPWASAAELARLANAARSGKASREELTGSTITVTSLGALGGIVSTPVINHPEVAIVGVNRIAERPTMRAGQVVARRLMNLSSSFDHRVVDGIDAARFIQALRGYLEFPATLFIE